jgi:raffinose/stachyose/melibiose transport system permease protein
MSTTAPPRPAAAPQAQRRPTRAAATPLRRLARKNPLAPTAGLLWLVLVVVPLYSIVVASLRAQADFLSSNPLALPAHSTLDNYSLVLHNDFLRYLLNSAIVTAASVVLAVGVSLMAAYAIVRGAGGAGRLTFNLFLLGLAIPLQATIIPIYFLITRMHLYDTLVARVLPSVAFAIPVPC